MTGTPVFAAVFVLEGGPHTVGSMMKGLSNSMLVISHNGSMPDARLYIGRNVSLGPRQARAPVEHLGLPGDDDVRSNS